MIDTLTVLVSHGLLAYILFRAVVLNRTLPWFEPVTGDSGDGERDTNEDQSTKAPRSKGRAGSKGRTGRFQPRFRNKPPA